MSQLVSINVGLPKDVQWNGNTIRTAIWKSPMQGAVRATRLNLAGDGQADLVGHGGEHRAVMVYQLDSYRYWAKFLGRSDFVHGQFGENLTVEGLSDEEVCIGDRYRIGGAVFEVTQPRVTCYKVGMRMNTPQMPALLVAHRRPGFYFRVIEEGDIAAGDTITKIADGPERMSVAQVDQLLYTPNRTQEALRRVLQIPALSLGWQESFRTLATGSSGGQPAGTVAVPDQWQGYRPLRVMDVIQESEDVRSFVLAAEDGKPLPPALPGQYIAIQVSVAAPATAALTPEVRCYSLSGPPTCGTYRISVKRESAGRISRYLHDTVHTGDILHASVPRGDFVLPPGNSPVVLLSAGIGITPMLAMLHATADAQTADSCRPIWWIHAARDGAHDALSNEARTLQNTLRTCHACVFYSRPRPSDTAGVQYDYTGHVDDKYFLSSGIPKDADFYLCGPPAFLDTVTAQLRDWAGDDAKVHHEFFGSIPSSRPGAPQRETRPHVPDGEPGAGPRVTFIRSGLSLPWNSRFTSLLEFAEACAVPVQWSCRTGVCHYCEVSITEGTLNYQPQPLDPPAKGKALICCSTPSSKIQLDL